MASLQQRTPELIPLEVHIKCSLCKHAVSQSNTLYCTKLKKNVKDVMDCPDFEPEPLEYKLYKRM